MESKRSVPLALVIASFVLFTAIFGIALYTLIDRHEKSEREMGALRTAENLTQGISAFRSYYSERVLPRAIEAGSDIAHGPDAEGGKALLPFTMAMDFSNFLRERGAKLNYLLFSRHPFPGREGRILDDAERQALERLEGHEVKSVSVQTHIDGRDMIRYFTPVLMAQSCVDCHNSHPESPKKDWTVGAVRGVQEVIVPVDAADGSSEAADESFANILFLVVTGLLGLSGFVCFLLYRDRQAVIALGRMADLERGKNVELAETALKLEEGVARLNAVLENAADAVITIDAEGIIESVNEATEQIFGYPRGELVGRNVKILMPESDASRHDDYIRRHLETGESRIIGIGREVEGRRADGTVFPLDLSIGRVDVGGRKIFTAILRDISERRRAEETERMLSLVASRTDNAVVITDRDGFTEWVNDAFERISGYASEEIIGKKPGALLQGDDTDPLVVERIGAALREARGFNEALINYAKNGTPYWVSIDVQPVYDSEGNVIRFIAIERDITETKEREEELRQARRQAEIVQRQLTEALDTLPDAFVIFDAEDRISLFNSRYKELYAASAPLIETGNRFEDVLRYGLEMGQYPDAVGREDEWLIERMAAHNNPSEPVEQRLEDGRWLRIVERRTPNGGCVGFRVDITELKEKQQALDDSRLQAEIANETKSRFLATMSHEIRTPLNGVIGALSLLSETTLDNQNQQFVATGRRAAESLLSLINDILDFSKMEAERLELDPVPVDLTQIVGDVLAVLRPKAEEKGLALAAEFDPDLPTAVIADPDRLKQILFNLAGNAVKFTDQGSVKVRCRKIAVAEPSVFLRFEILDTGKGVPESDRKILFDEFWSTGRDGGTGLGLAICRRLVDIMGGDIGVEGGPGGGSLFWVELPLSPTSPEAVDARQRPLVRGSERPEDVGTLSGNVLLAEDNPANQLILKSMVERYGLKVETVGDGHEAVEAVRGRDYDLVLMDVNMPRMTGTEAVKAIRGMGSGKARVPVVAVTAHVMSGDRETLISEDFDDYLGKPVHWSELGQCLAYWLSPENRRGRAETVAASEAAEDQDVAAREQEQEPEADGSAADILPVSAYDAEMVDELVRNTSEEIAIEIIDLLSGELRKTDDELRGLLAEEKWADVGRLAHRIKGSVANLGLTGLSDLCFRMEKAAASGRFEELPALSDTYLASIDGACDRLRQFQDELAMA
ncbi:PAS domain S-box protein [Nisaea nitritireducens]|uniref:PAS domain S-box protein n=1 Tax=Nisaea nitritireducens TaxID=568392 RepID=UPI0029C0EF5B|nr:PAS domain S-box protein [Nisaea nitritireducens]